jgi:hypothetical protein
MPSVIDRASNFNVSVEFTEACFGIVRISFQALSVTFHAEKIRLSIIPLNRAISTFHRQGDFH